MTRFLIWAAGTNIDNLFPLIVIILIVIVSLLRAVFKALGAAKQTQATRDRPSVWQEFKKALQEMAEQQQGDRRPIEPEEMEEEEGESAEEAPPTPVAPSPPLVRKRVIYVRPGQAMRRGMPEQVGPARQPIPVVVPPVQRHRPEDLGSDIAREVSDIVHPPVEAHLKERGLFGRLPSASGAAQDQTLAALRHLAGASPDELRRAILLYEVIGPPVAERMPGPPLALK
jgi:hypothetical protein